MQQCRVRGVLVVASGARGLEFTSPGLNDLGLVHRVLVVTFSAALGLGLPSD